jgi:hypothetical protein
LQSVELASKLLTSTEPNRGSQLPMTTAMSHLRFFAGSCALAVAVATCVNPPARSDDPPARSSDEGLQYAERGSHWEGLREIPISGGVELLSARLIADGAERGEIPPPSSEWGDRARLRFYLPSEDRGRVTVTVRQFRSGSTYYLLDRVSAAWNPGSVNEYAWPTAPVLRKLTNVRPDDLGAVVNVGPGKGTNNEKVLPVALFDEAVDSGTQGYRFSFKTDGSARVDAVVLADTREIFRRPTKREEPGSPFTVGWSASGMAEGWYRLLLTGQFDDLTPLDKEVTFYHRPVLGSAGSQLR